jgi:hypothetical protein
MDGWIELEYRRLGQSHEVRVARWSDTKRIADDGIFVTIGVDAFDGQTPDRLPGVGGAVGYVLLRPIRSPPDPAR